MPKLRSWKKFGRSEFMPLRRSHLICSYRAIGRAILTICRGAWFIFGVYQMAFGQNFYLILLFLTIPTVKIKCLSILNLVFEITCQNIQLEICRKIKRYWSERDNLIQTIPTEIVYLNASETWHTVTILASTREGAGIVGKRDTEITELLFA